MTTRVLLYEFVTGGGWWSAADEPPAGSLLAEGRAMVRSLAADFAALGDIKVWTSRDARLPALHPPGCHVEVMQSAEAELAWLARSSAAADWTLLIAPETGGALARRCRLVESAGGRLLSPPPAVVELAGNKQRTADWLTSHGVPTPRGRLLDGGATGDLNFPAVVKPVGGCGSSGVRLVVSEADLKQSFNEQFVRIEEFISGIAASVAMLCGPRGCYAVPACEQRLSDDGSFAYLGGRLPLPQRLTDRATRLALAAVRTLPQSIGYIGVDLVLGAADDGRGDRVIEINPRLTTSYVGLRELAQVNLAAAMLAVASGEEPDLRFGSQPIEFTSDGVIST